MDVSRYIGAPLWRRRAGLTLMELMVALFVFSVGSMGAMQMYFYTMEQGKGMRETALADSLLLNEWHYLKALPFDEVAALQDAPFQHTPALPERLYQAQSRVTAALVPETPGLLEVDLEIRWIHRGGRVVVRIQRFLLADKANHVE